MASVMKDLLYKHKLSDQTMIKFLYTTQHFTSNTDMSSVLRKAIPQLNVKNNEVMNEFFRTVEGFTSNTDMRHVLSSLLEREDLTKDNLLSVLKTCNFFTSNTDMESVMLEVSKFIGKNDEELKEAYINTARMFTSETSYRHVMEALNN
jgi:hypothetical protein